MNFSALCTIEKFSLLFFYFHLTDLTSDSRLGKIYWLSSLNSISVYLWNIDANYFYRSIAISCIIFSTFQVLIYNIFFFKIKSTEIDILPFYQLDCIHLFFAWLLRCIFPAYISLKQVLPRSVLCVLLFYIFFCRIADTPTDQILNICIHNAKWIWITVFLPYPFLDFVFKCLLFW